MNKIISVLVIMLLSTTAFAKDKVYRYYEEVKFGKSYEVNEYDDGLNTPEGFDYYSFGLSFELPEGVSIASIAAKVYPGSFDYIGGCEFIEPVIKDNANGTKSVTVDTNTSLEVDDGSACEYTVELSNGQTGSILFYQTGT